MKLPASIAANAYAQTSQITPAKSTLSQSSGLEKGSDFSAVLEKAVNSVVESGKNADAVSLNHVKGNADVIDVVTAVSESEIAVRTLVNVRDRMISAYQDIMKMPI